MIHHNGLTKLPNSVTKVSVVTRRMLLDSAEPLVGSPSEFRWIWSDEDQTNDDVVAYTILA